MMTKNEIQKIIIDKIKNALFRGIVLVSVRVGKTRIILETIKEISNNDLNIKVLIGYPNIDIKNSWISETEKLNYYPNIEYSTFKSLKKVQDNKYDFVIFDEGHAIPPDNILPTVSKIVKNNNKCIIMSGTYSEDTLLNLKFSTGLQQIVDYSTDDAINDRIVNDFKVKVHLFKLDNVKSIQFGGIKKWYSTDYKECLRMSKKLDESFGKDKMMIALFRMKMINSCQSLIKVVKQWIENNPNKRFILFTGDEKVGMNYNIPMFNSKSKNNDVLKDFQEYRSNSLCLIKKGGTGVTYEGLDTILITDINSNSETLEQRCGRSLLFEEDKESVVHIFCSTEDFQIRWLESSLKSINSNRISYKYI
jgi:superfamily II DNA or RNA helicase